MHQTIVAAAAALLTDGDEPGLMMSQSAARLDMIDHLPAFYGARRNAGHTATVAYPGGEFANTASKRLRWTQKRDEKAGAMFAGKNSSRYQSELGRALERSQEMKSQIALAAIAGCAAAVVCAQSPSSSFPRGNSMQSWQNPGLKNVLAKCRNPPPPFSIPVARQSANANAAPPDPVLPATTAIPGVLAPGQSWKVVWSWQGNNVDGPIAGDNGTVLFANNDASNVMQLDPSTGLAKIVYRDTNTGGAISRSKNGELFVAERGLGSAIKELAPQRKLLANSFHGEPLECVGGVVNDLVADAHGGVYFSVTGAVGSGLFYADSKGAVSQYGKDIPLANGIILSPDEKTLYVTNGAVVFAFGVKPDGLLTNQREFGKLRGGQGGDGSAVDQQGRVYVATGKSVDVFGPDGTFAGSIPGQQGLHGTFFGGRDKRTLFGIVFYGGWGTPSARNRIIAIPTIAQGYTGRAK